MSKPGSPLSSHGPVVTFIVFYNNGGAYMSVSTSLELFKGSNQVLLTEIFLGVNMVPGIKGEVHSFELS